MKVRKIVEAFNLQLIEYQNRFQGCCPIHKGDNNTAFTLYKESGNWQCFTYGCHYQYGSNAIGLVQALLQCERDVAIKHLEEILGGKIEFTSDVNYAFTVRDKIKCTKVKREHIRQKLDIPGNYFIKRGFSEAVLDKYDVGLCLNKDSKFANRCVVPIYDVDYNHVIVYTGRDITEKAKPKWLHDKFERNSIL